MVREYRWQFKVRSYETDAWGQVPASGILRYLEQAAVAAAADAGYGSEFHRESNSAWVVRRMSLLAPTPVRGGAELEITTWISHFARVRGGREYRITNIQTGELLATGLAEWVYLNRQTLAPIAIPPHVAADFDPPGAPIGQYDLPSIAADDAPPEFITERTAQWHEADSMGHVNNAVYADWLDDALSAVLEGMGYSIKALREENIQLRGEHYKLDYKRGTLPGDKLRIATRISGRQDSLYAVDQAITAPDSTQLLTASSIYRWRTSGGDAETWGHPPPVINGHLPGMGFAPAPQV